jgi:hypothetical protein
MSVWHIYYKELFLYAKALPKSHLRHGGPEKRRILIPYNMPQATPTKFM